MTPQDYARLATVKSGLVHMSDTDLTAIRESAQSRYRESVHTCDADSTTRAQDTITAVNTILREREIARYDDSLTLLPGKTLTQMLRKAYREQSRVIVVTRTYVYDGYITGWQGKSIVISATNSAYGFTPIGAFSYASVQYIGPSNSEPLAPCGSVQWSHSAQSEYINPQYVR